MKNVNNLYKNTSMKLSTAAVVLLSALGVSTVANAAPTDHFISVAPGATDTTKGNYNNDGAKSDDSVAIGKDAAAGVSKDVAVGDNAKANNHTTSKAQKIGGEQLLVLTRLLKETVRVHTVMVQKLRRRMLLL